MSADVGRRPESAGIRRAQFAQQYGTKINCLMSIRHQLQTNFESSKGFAQKSQPSSPSNLSVAAYAAHVPILRIDPRFHLGAARVRRASITLSGCSLLQALVRTNLIVRPHPAIGTSLLCPHRARDRSRRLGLHYSMHLFVPPVLFRVPWSNELDLDPQSSPPGAQPGQPRRPVGTKGPAIVHSDYFGSPILPEQAHKHYSHAPPLLIGQQPNRQKIATEQISNRQRLDPASIAGAEPSFEVDRPHLVGRLRHSQLRAHHHRASAARRVARPGQTQPLNTASDCAHCGNSLAGILSTQSSADLSGSPASMAPTHLPNALHPTRSNLVGWVFGPSRSIAQTTMTAVPKTRLPLVSGLAADVKESTQLPKGLMGLQEQLYEATTCFDQRDRFPRHSRGKAANPTKKCYPCLGLSVSPMSWPRAERRRVLTGAPLLVPLPTRSSRGEDAELDADWTTSDAETSDCTPIERGS